MFSQIQNVLEALRSGSFIAISDDCSSLPSLCLVKDSARITAGDVNFLAAKARGVICAAIQEPHRKLLGLPLMADVSIGGTPQGDCLRPLQEDSRQFDFTVSIEARHGVSTGISAADRAQTLQTLARTSDPRRDLITPGHVFPARTQDGGVLVKASLAEAAMDLLLLAGLKPNEGFPVATFVQCLSERGSFLSEQETVDFVKREGLAHTSLSELIRYRLSHESLISRVAEAKLPIETDEGFRAICYRSAVDGAEHLALVHGDLRSPEGGSEETLVLVRVQAEAPFQDIFGFEEKTGLASLRAAMSQIAEHGPGVLVYIRHPERSLSVSQVRDSTPSGSAQKSGIQVLREMGIGAQILVDLGVKRAKILSRSPRDLSALAAFPFEVVEQVPFSDPTR